MADTLHVFSGRFGSSLRATKYTQEHWEVPAPDDSWPKEEYDAYEFRNPNWQLRDDLTVPHMDSDFVETIHGDARMAYLQEQLCKSEDYELLVTLIPDNHDTLVLILSSAFSESSQELKSTDSLMYHGTFLWQANSD